MEKTTGTAGAKVLAPLRLNERLAYGAGSMGTFFVATIVSGYLMFFYSNQLALDTGIIGTLMLISRLFLAVLCGGHICIFAEDACEMAG